MSDVMTDFNGIRQLYNWVENFDHKFDHFLDDLVKDAGLRMLRSTKQLTPVGIYAPDSGMVGGSLRNSWKLTRLIQRGGEREISVYADPMIAPYAPYVEHGHRLVRGLKFQLPDGSWRRTKRTGWWEGYHMAKDSFDKVNRGFLRSYEVRFNNFIRTVTVGG